MAELAASAVSSLLVAIRSEARLLRGVGDDVQFINEEMESMKSFLEHLARWAPPGGGEHNEQVRSWMNQVRLLAQDCSNCIDLYLSRGNPDVYRARGGLRGYLWWVTWLRRKLVVQHRAAEQLRLLKVRAREIGARRLRYGVEVSAVQVPPTAASLLAAAGVDDDEEVEDGDGHSAQRAFTEPRTLDDHVMAKLWEWLNGIPGNAGETFSMVAVAPYKYQDLLALVQFFWLLSQNGEGVYDRIVVVDIQAVHHDSKPLRVKEVLFYILRQLKHAKSNPEDTEGQVKDTYLDSSEVYIKRMQIYGEKKRVIALLDIEESIAEMEIYEKLDKIKSDIQGRPPMGGMLQGDFDQLDLDVLLQLLLETASQQDQRGKNKDMHRLPAWDKSNITIKKLKEHMEAKEKDKKLEEEEAAKHMGAKEGEEAAAKHMEEEGGEVTGKHMEEGGGEATIHREEEGGGSGGGETAKHMKKEEGGGEIKSQETAWIQLDEAQYAHILRKLFPKSSSSTKPMQAQDRSLDKQATKTTAATLGEDQIKKLIHDAKEDI